MFTRPYTYYIHADMFTRPYESLTGCVPLRHADLLARIFTSQAFECFADFIAQPLHETDANDCNFGYPVMHGSLRRASVLAWPRLTTGRNYKRCITNFINRNFEYIWTHSTPPEGPGRGQLRARCR